MNGPKAIHRTPEAAAGDDFVEETLLCEMVPFGLVTGVDCRIPSEKGSWSICDSFCLRALISQSSTRRRPFHACRPCLQKEVNTQSVLPA